MGRKFNFGGVPTEHTLPKGCFHVEFVDMEERQSKKDPSKPKLGYSAEYRIEAPSQYKGRIQREYYNIGTNDDPQANDPKTFDASRGAIDMKLAFSKMKVRIPNGSIDMDALIEQARGRKMAVIIGHQSREGRDHPDARITWYYTTEERQPELFDVGIRTSAPAERVPTTKAATEVFDLDEEEDDTEDAADEDEDEEPEPAPRRAKGKVNAENPLKPVRKKKPEETQCPKCEGLFPREQMLDHLDECTA